MSTTTAWMSVRGIHLDYDRRNLLVATGLGRVRRFDPTRDDRTVIMGRLITTDPFPPADAFQIELEESPMQIDEQLPPPRDIFEVARSHGVDPTLALDFLAAIISERRHAHEKHGPTSMEQTGLLEHRRASILAEEAVECGRALNDYDHNPVKHSLRTEYLPPPSGLRPRSDALDEELIQTAAMAYTWWANRRGDRLPAVEPKPEVPGDLLVLLDELADPDSPLQGALGDPDVAARARRLLTGLTGPR